MAAAAALLLVVSPTPAAGPLDAPAVPAETASTHVIVRLRPGVAARALADGRWTLEPEARRRPRRSGRIATVLSRWQTSAIGPALSRGPVNSRLAGELRLDRYVRVEVPEGTDTTAMATVLERLTDVVESAQPDGIGTTAGMIPNDPLFTVQYALDNTGQAINGQPGTPGADVAATDAWTITTGSPDTVLAVLDAGVDTHVQLGGRLLPGWNTVSNNDDTSDACFSHGTHVTGIAAALGNDGVGTAGMNWNTQILPVRILNGCSGFESSLAAGIIWAVDNGADVINMSLQYSAGSDFLRDAVRYAYEQDVIMIAATGNNGFTGGVAFPARLPETIAVGGTDNRDFPPTLGGSGWTSNGGPEIDVCAPGDDIYSLTGSSQYTFRDGTSMATPHVSGLVTLMLSVNPELTTEAVRKILRETAVDIWTPGFDEATGYGRIDSFAAVARVLQGLNTPGDVTGDALVNVHDLVAVFEAWGPCEPDTICPADLDENGVVDVEDMTIVILNWGAGPD